MLKNEHGSLIPTNNNTCKYLQELLIIKVFFMKNHQFIVQFFLNLFKHNTQLSEFIE